MRRNLYVLIAFFCLACLFSPHSLAQQTLGSINGTVSDISGGVLGKVTVKVHSAETNLEQTAVTKDDGSFLIVGLPIGKYSVSFSRDGFKTEVHDQILVQGGLTTTVNGSLQPGEVTAQITVSGTPLLNQTDTTNGYTLGTDLIENTPLGTGSFTQLALLSPGVNADFLTGSGTNAGLGNQNIFANGQRDTSNSFIINGVQENNLLNGKSSSGVADNRAVLNTGEVFSSIGGEIQTSTSVYSAIGQALPSPAPETLEEIRVNTSMYDASEGAYSGAHITSQTKVGANDFHGGAYEYFQTSAWNAAPFFFNASPALHDPNGPTHGNTVPYLRRNSFGATLGGPIFKDKMFFFASYQGQRVVDQDSSISEVKTLPGLTDTNRDAASLQQLIDPGCTSGGGSNPCPNIDPVALKIMNLKLPNGQFLIPSETFSSNSPQGVAEQLKFGYNAFVVGPNTTFNADQINGNIDYNIGAKDRLSSKYYFQSDPTYAPFAISQSGGFPQTLSSASQAYSLENTVTISPNAVWTQHFGFLRERAFAHTQDGYTNSDYGMTIFGLSSVPGISITNPDPNLSGGFAFGPASNFANAGVFQNEFEGATKYSWTVGRHTLAFGFQWDHVQLNVVNRNNATAELNFNNFAAFLEGKLCTPAAEFGCGETGPSTFIGGATSRYYRSNQAGTYATDTYRITQNLTLTLGVRWDWDGPLSEKNGLLANFYPQDYSYTQCTIGGVAGAPAPGGRCDPGTDIINNSGIVVAGNNKQFCATKSSICVNDSTLKGRQWGFAPRFGLAWTPSFMKNLVIRTGFGMYYDRGEYLAELSPSAGGNYNGPFGVTVEAPFVIPLFSQPGSTFSAPFSTYGNTPPPPPTTVAGIAGLFPNIANLVNQTTPYCSSISTTFFCSPVQFAAYNPNNKLPYSENWLLDVQWQPRNDLVLTISYVGNHGVHENIPVPFNQPGLATVTNPIHGQTSTYGYNVVASETINSLVEGFSSGNVDLRVPYIGFDPNSQYNEAAGISNYHALQFHVTKRASHGLTISGSYTWSHAMDEESGEQLFYNGDNPQNLRTGYGNSDFDRRHVFIVSYQYDFPKLSKLHGWTDQLINGWGTNGLVSAESGQPFSVIDFSGGIASIYFGGGNDFVTNPLVPVGAVGSSSTKPVEQGTLGVNPNNPVLNPAAFGIPLLTPSASNGIPAGDNLETGFGPASRNIFRGPFQSRVDMGLFKNFKISERFKLKFDFQAFNIFNHPSFDTPNNNVEFNPFFSNPPQYFPPLPVAGQVNCTANNGYVCPPSGELGLIQHTIGSPRFLQMALHFTF
ncbi:MAG TPA: TonB-dependent receptor [Candidatus Acidoferrum sp.]|nr:TonB-dependent receptor [Candidatus Acidoferrum sp.]